MIDGPGTAARSKNNRQLEFDHHVQHELLLIDRYEHAAQTLDDQPIVQQAGRQIDAAQIDFHACPTRCQIGRNRRHKLVHLVERAVRANAREPHHRYAVGAFECPGLDGLPVNRIQRRAKKRGERRLPDAGIRAGNKEMMSHAGPADCSGWFCARTFSSKDGARQAQSASRRFPWQQIALMAAARLVACCEKSLFMGSRLYPVVSCSGNEGMLPSLCNCFSPAYSPRYRPINVPNPLSLRSPAMGFRPVKTPLLRLTSHSAKCYKTTFCVRP